MMRPLSKISILLVIVMHYMHHINSVGESVV